MLADFGIVTLIPRYWHEAGDQHNNFTPSDPPDYHQTRRGCRCLSFLGGHVVSRLITVQSGYDVGGIPESMFCQLIQVCHAQILS